MPVIFREGPYRVYFHSHEPNEPIHVHVDRDASSAKFWMDPIALARNIGFPPQELSRIKKIITKNKSKIMEAWYGYFGISG